VSVFCVGTQTSVIGSSMEPVLYNGQHIFLDKIIYKVSSPRRGDVIVFLPNGNEKSHYYVKRVIGVPDDELYIRGGVLYVNDEAVLEYYNDKIAEPGILESKVTLGEDEYFVIGDNVNSSEDSRSANIGMVRKSYIIGKAWFKMASGDSDIGRVK
jgi:signal peptidase I